jgi:hypothetical protein
MNILKSKTFWLVLSVVNVMSAMICAFCGSFEGVATCLISLGACMVSYHLSDKV